MVPGPAKPRSDVQTANGGIGRKSRPACIPGAAQNELVVSAEQTRTRICFQCAAESRRASSGLIQLAIGQLNRECFDGLPLEIRRDFAIIEAEEGRLCIAGPKIAGVSVQSALIKPGEIEISVDRYGIRQSNTGFEIHKCKAIPGCVRVGEHSGARCLQQLDRRDAVAGQIRARAEHIELHSPTSALPVEVGKQAVQTGRGMFSPATFTSPFRCCVEGRVSLLHATLKTAFQPAKRSTGDNRLITLKSEAILELHSDGSAKRVQPEHRIGAFDIQTRNRRFRNQVPIDRISKRVVQAHTTGIDRQSLRIARKRRSLEAAVKQVWLKRVILGV